eukprot:TRINITY_DN476_c0_g1::TRINITY_DN476_c0_g1_i2::g.2517::m.2517 TRINITY_DN476_c0_g1::TRINITY_DN476_c0_g1_i2::g.2517  ORF type:complete len:468 (-),score=156.35,sp/Q9SFX3/OST1A_ARATH/37.00/2e-94,Ribophorin_I/PF04597.9/1.4e-115 TRINITY_DN476_c0_g1_i2:616-1980(-)
MKLGLLSLLLLVCASLVACDLINKSVEREIDLSTQTTRHNITVVLENTGSSAVHEAEFGFHSRVACNLAFLDVKSGDKSLNIKSRNTEDGHSIHTVEVDIPASKSVTLIIDAAFSEATRPRPTEIQQHEPQLMVYEDALYFYSPYLTEEQTTTVFLPGNNVETFTKTKPVEHEEDTITWGPHRNIKPFTFSPMRVHYEANMKYFTVEKFTRELELSHWGSNVAVIDTFDIKQTGAKHTGAFSRYDLQRNRMGSGVSAVKDFVAFIHHDSQDMYYRDRIGNISTSAYRVTDENVEVFIEPRFPLFGGWAIDFTLGYNVPLSSVLGLSNSGSYVFEYTFGCPLEDAVVANHEIRVVLPEGARNIRYNFPFAVDSVDIEYKHSTLDILGRPVVVIRKTKVVEEHDEPFQIAYDYPSVLMLRQPLLLVSGFGAFFMAFILASRVSISFSPSEPKPKSD